MATRKRTVEARDPLSGWVEPQLTLLVEAPPAGDAWAHEINYGGYRTHLILDRDKVRLKGWRGTGQAE